MVYSIASRTLPVSSWVCACALLACSIHKDETSGAGKTSFEAAQLDNSTEDHTLSWIAVAGDQGVHVVTPEEKEKLELNFTGAAHAGYPPTQETRYSSINAPERYFDTGRAAFESAYEEFASRGVDYLDASTKDGAFLLPPGTFRYRMFAKAQATITYAGDSKGFAMDLAAGSPDQATRLMALNRLRQKAGMPEATELTVMEKALLNHSVDHVDIESVAGEELSLQVGDLNISSQPMPSALAKADALKKAIANALSMIPPTSLLRPGDGACSEGSQVVASVTAGVNIFKITNYEGEEQAFNGDLEPLSISQGSHQDGAHGLKIYAYKCPNIKDPSNQEAVGRTQPMPKFETKIDVGPGTEPYMKFTTTESTEAFGLIVDDRNQARQNETSTKDLRKVHHSASERTVEDMVTPGGPECIGLIVITFKIDKTNDRPIEN